jgi:FkbM family methyltransferase
MKSYSQYGEESVILSFFNNTKHGCLVDVGAADGITNSNSRYLIENLEWSGILIEPHPKFYESLVSLYEKNPNIVVQNIALHNHVGEMPFYAYGFNVHENAQVSTLSEAFKERVVKLYGNRYESSILVKVNTLSNILKTVEKCDFLSIDCEGVDMHVLQSNDWSLYRPGLVCVEHSMPIHELDEYMISQTYKLHTRTGGNSFYSDSMKVSI